MFILFNTLQFPYHPHRAGTMARIAHGCIEVGEAAPGVQLLRGFHVGHCLQVTAGVTGLCGKVEAPFHHQRTHTRAARFGQEIHLLELAGIGRAIGQRRYPRSRARPFPLHNIPNVMFASWTGKIKFVF